MSVKPLVAGFTGTRDGMTEPQEWQLRRMLEKCDVLKHGDCKGSDEKAHQLMVSLGTTSTKFIEVHPPTNPKLRARCEGANQVFPPKPYRERNRDIVDGCRVLIATPKSKNEEQYSGTWSTIRYAVSIGRPVRIIYPDGEVEIR
jgi:hypothetical protein